MRKIEAKSGLPVFAIFCSLSKKLKAKSAKMKTSYGITVLMSR
jgi:hypothetical protein